MLIDTHCHINFRDFDADRETVITNAKKAGVKRFIVPGDDASSSQSAVELAGRCPGTVFAAAGFHPYESQHVTPEDTIRFLESILKPPATDHGLPAIVAVGEIGLDYHIYKGEAAVGRKDVQKRLFEIQLRFALDHDLPVIIHGRDAFADIFSVLDALPVMPRGVIHCFSGGLQDIRMAAERHLFAGLDGNVTYSKHLQAIIPSVPLSMILLETDSPYLTPVPHRGERNEPKYIPAIAKFLAHLHNASAEAVARQTTGNAQTLFRLSS